jgi:hypothetical protein
LGATALLLLFSFLSVAHGAGPLSEPEATYLNENDVAMTRMMNAMSVSPSGDVDHDFVSMMIPHHHGAIDMAQAELRYGKNEQLRRIAQEIVVEQQQEIVAMHVALGQALPSSSLDQMAPGSSVARGDASSDAAGEKHMHMHMQGAGQMSMEGDK